MLQSCYVIQSISLPSQGNTQRLTEDISAIGGSALISLSPSVLDATNDYLVCRSVRRLHPDTRIQAFYKAEIGNCIFLLTMAEYANVTGYTVSYRKAGSQEFGMVQFFFTIPFLSTPLVVIKRLETIEVSSQDHFNPIVSNINHIIPVQETTELHVTELKSIERKVLYISFLVVSVNSTFVYFLLSVCRTRCCTF